MTLGPGRGEDPDLLIVEQLVEVAVAGEAGHAAALAQRYAGGGRDHVVALVVSELHPPDPSGVQGLLDPGQGLDRGVVGVGTVGLVIADGGDTSAVPDSPSKTTSISLFGAWRWCALRARARNPKTPVRARVRSRLVIRAGKPNQAR